MRQERADAVLDVLLRHGVNHIDTAASYGDSELRIGPWMAEHRDRFFLATKTGERTGDGARAELERSLERLRVDSVDLIQLHNLVEPEELEVAHGPGGAVSALARARDEGLVRFVGVTGHGTRIAAAHLSSLARFPFDSVLLPYSFVGLQDPSYRADVEALLARVRRAGRGGPDHQVGGAPAVAAGRRRARTSPGTSRWPSRACSTGRWPGCSSNPQVFLNTSSDATLLPAILTAAERAAAPGATPPDDAALRADVAGEGIEPLFDGAGLERI